MLKKRIIAVLLFKDGVLTRTKNFKPDYIYTKNQINTDHCDEICCIRVGGDWQSFFDAVNHVADDAMLPLTVGGGIESLADVGNIFRECPADKIVVEEHLDTLARPVLAKYGRQSLVGGATEGRDVSREIGRVGEIFVQSVDRDGSLRGYPLDFCKQFLDFNVPIVISSGCEGYRSMLAGFNAGMDACGTSNIHHFTPTGMKGIRDRLIKGGIPLRTGAHAA